MSGRFSLTFVLVFCLGAAAAMWLWLGQRNPAPVELKLATGPTEGAFHSLGLGIAQIVHQTHPEITISLTQDSQGSIDNMDRLGRGEVDLAIVQNDTAPAPDVQTLLPLHRAVCHFLVPKSSDIQSVYDLRGKRVGVGQQNSGNQQIVRALLDHFGLRESQNDYIPVYEGIAQCSVKLDVGTLDAALIMTAVTNQSVVDLVGRGNVRYVSLASSGEGNEVDGFAVMNPYVERFIIPRHVYPVHDDRHGLPESPCETFALRSTLICRGDLPDAVARTIVESIVTQRAVIMRQHHEARDISEQFDSDDVQFPIHYGAMAYFQRLRPSFLERYSEPMAFLLSLILAFCGLVAGLNKWLSVRKKNRVDRYYVRLDGLLTELNSGETHRLDAIENELIAMRHEAVRELVDEKLMADDSFQIFQSLLTDCQKQLALRRVTSQHPHAN
ncbi:TAXI family TRAP transporter solute-binding subunit [Stieleria varia]|uniref:NMT1/THI5 like protein n=1 Tax=Stieleria varia TaxID=2528005 RepID=A0A5C6AYR9_9BACT|nr:TAXI family TRAP transporter solute-binding subunit [Stieleria varia]TWU04617.1 NMT1/THI5 like protein [Stieleria varia]